METIPVGGRALANGVMMETNSYRVHSRYIKGEIDLEETRIPFIFNNSVVDFLMSIPFIRGIVSFGRLFIASKKFWIIASSLIVFLMLTIWLLTYYDIVTDGEVSSFSRGSYFLVIATDGAILLFLRQRYGKFHGAEHKAINAYQEIRDENLLTVENVKKASRIADRCGTNLVIIVIILRILVMPLQLHIEPTLLNLIVLSVGYEIFTYSHNKYLYPFLYIGRLAQKFITTIEPTEYEIKSSIASLKRVIELEKNILNEEKSV